MKKEHAIEAAMAAATGMQHAVLIDELGRRAGDPAIYWWQAQNRVLPEKEAFALAETLPEKLFDYCVKRDPNPATLFSYSCQVQGADPAGREPDFGYAAFIHAVKLLAPLVETEAEPVPEVQPTGAPLPRQLRQKGRSDKRIKAPVATNTDKPGGSNSAKAGRGKANKGSN